MKKLLLTGLVIATCSSLFAQHSLEKIWQSDSTTLKSPESVLYDAVSNSLYVSSMGSGSVVKMGLDGKILQNNWATGLASNKGSALYNGMYYTAELTAVAVIDKTGAIVKRIPIEGAQMLNDVAIDSKGIIYVTDTRAAKVYKIVNDKPSLYLENMPGANGLLFVGADLYVLTSTSVQKVSVDKQVSKIAEGFVSGLDGIVMVANNEFVVSNYQGMMYYVNADGTIQVLQDTRAARISSNDISYDPKTKTVYVASYGTNRIIAYKIK